MKSVVIKEQYIREQGWPESLVNQARIVRKENAHSVSIVNGEEKGKYRVIPKDQIQFISSDADHLAVEQVQLPTNISALISAAERLYQTSYYNPVLAVPGRVLEVTDSHTQEMVVKDDQTELHRFYTVSHNGKTATVPAWCVMALPKVPFNPDDIDSFVRKFGLERFKDVTEGFSQIVKAKEDGTFVTKDFWAGEHKFTIRRKAGRQGAIELKSKFGAFQTIPEVI